MIIYLDCLQQYFLSRLISVWIEYRSFADSKVATLFLNNREIFRSLWVEVFTIETGNCLLHGILTYQADIQRNLHMNIYNRI